MILRNSLDPKNVDSITLPLPYRHQGETDEIVQRDLAAHQRIEWSSR